MRKFVKSYFIYFCAQLGQLNKIDWKSELWIVPINIKKKILKN